MMLLELRNIADEKNLFLRKSHIVLEEFIRIFGNLIHVQYSNSENIVEAGCWEDFMRNTVCGAVFCFQSWFIFDWKIVLSLLVDYIFIVNMASNKGFVD